MLCGVGICQYLIKKEKEKKIHKKKKKKKFLINEKN